ncbi:TPA: hypothetical protein F8V06_13995 [Legionella pneumophila]|nr:hypothetical protein [Legionella pneumophila]
MVLFVRIPADPLINSKELFTQFGELVPEQGRANYLDLIQWELFTGSVRELKELETLFSWQTIQKLIPSRLSAAQLNCTEEEFSALLLHHSSEKKARIDKFNSKSAADRLKVYVEERTPRFSSLFKPFGMGFSEERLNTAKQLIKTMESKSLTSLEKIEALQSTLDELRNRYDSRGQLEWLISEIIEDESPASYSSNSATMFYLRPFKDLPNKEEQINPWRNRWLF